MINRVSGALAAPKAKNHDITLCHWRRDIGTGLSQHVTNLKIDDQRGLSQVLYVLDDLKGSS